MVRALSVFCMVEVAGGVGTRKLGVGKIAVAFIPGLSELLVTYWIVRATLNVCEIRSRFVIEIYSTIPNVFGNTLL